MSDAPGPILATRDDLLAIIRAAGVAAIPYASTRFVAPVVLVEPGDPWVEPATLGRGWATVRWVGWLLTGAGDSAVALERVAGLAEAVVLALARAPGWTYPTASGARLVRVTGVEGGYTGSRITVQTIADMTGGT